MDMRWWAVALALTAFSGCLDDETDDAAPTPDAPQVPMQENATFEKFVLPAVHTGHGLYEPTIDVSDSGVIYVSAHSTGVGVVPAPGYYSNDDGASWNTLPLVASASSPPESQGSAPPFSDEIFIVAGDDGQAWGVDINLHSYLMAGWCDDGAENCYYNAQAYDHGQTVLQASDCAPLPLKDRPWVAASNGSLLLVNNPGGGPAQIASFTPPATLPAEVGPTASDIQWNLCASSGGFIPGIPGLREDGFFVVPQMQGSDLAAITGHVDDVMSTQETTVFAVDHAGATRSQISNYGQAAFDGDGTLWMSAMHNNGATASQDAGGFRIAISHDDAGSFRDATFRFDQPVSSIYIDGNPNGEGALINWGLVDGDRTDWYFGFLLQGDDGAPSLHHVVKAVDDGPDASRHVQGAAVGPDGRAYMVMSEVSGNDDQAMAEAAGTTPLSVVVQQDGPVLPGATTS